MYVREREHGVSRGRTHRKASSCDLLGTHEMKRSRDSRREEDTQKRRTFLLGLCKLLVTSFRVQVTTLMMIVVLNYMKLLRTRGRDGRYSPNRSWWTWAAALLSLFSANLIIDWTKIEQSCLLHLHCTSHSKVLALLISVGLLVSFHYICIYQRRGRKRSSWEM